MNSNDRQTKIFGVKIDFWIVVSLFLLFSTLYSLLSVTRHNHFQSQGIDFSIYDQALWLYSKFEYPFSTVTNLYDLADRFRPIMLPLSAFYWFTSNERILLLFQATILCAAVFPIWLIARKYLHKLLAIVIAFLYIDFIGIQAVNTYDFHEMSLAPFFFAWLFYCLIKRRWAGFFVFLLLSLSVREHVGLLLSTLAIYIWLTKRNWKVALATFAISLTWSILTIKVIMPALGQGHYVSFTQEGGTLENSLKFYLLDPPSIVANFFLPLQKTQTLLWTFFSFGLIPIIYLPLIPIIFFQFASRFLDLLHPIRWTLFFHYSAELAVLLSIATIFASRFILTRFKKFKFLWIILVIFLFFAHTTTNLVLDSPLKNLLKLQFWQYQNWMDDTRVILNKIPGDSSVASQNNLLPHLSHRKEVYLLPTVGDAKYVVVDLHPGQNNWNFYTGNLETAKLLLKNIILSNSYQVILSSDDVYLLKKI